jgi:flagellar motor switch protein FliG
MSMSSTDIAVAAITGPQKAAILLVQLGRERSALVLKSLRESEVEEVLGEIARLKNVDTSVVDSVMEEFQELAAARRYYGQGGMDFAREVLVASMGEEKAAELLRRMEASLVEMPFEFLRRADARQVLSFLQDEHPQTVALVLAHMRADQAAVVLSGMPDELQADVAHRVAVMENTSPEVVRQVEAILERKLSSVLQSTDFSAAGGLQPLIDIINHSDRSTERLILEGLERRDPALAEEVRAQMFMFEDILTLDDRSVQLVLRQVDSKELATSLKGVSQDVKDKIMSNISERAAANLADEIEMLGPVRLTTVEESQAVVIQTIRSLEESGQIILTRGDRDEYVV